jgi:hypothetical protein
LVPPTLSSLRDEKRVPSLHMHCSLRSLRLALVSRCLTRSQTKSVSARSLVQDSGAPAWLSTAARDPSLIAPLAKLAALSVSDGLLRNLLLAPLVRSRRVGAGY